MKSRDYCYWLQGYFEINGNAGKALTQKQTEMIQRHLHLVFKHEIDPSYPNGDELNQIHNPPNPISRPDSLIRC